ncbi:MAG TPA: FGGY family carbohydrate kinase [Puia sp.]|jgi:sugar (pentulose or hexulose) kinase|nr:FGGY family carbohydrate kinase [Puia sp.]
MNVIAILDTGKTNKKMFLFDENYKIVWEQSTSFSETTDEQGDACEDVDKLTAWVKDAYRELQQLKDFEIKAVNFSAYGASLVHIDKAGLPAAPLYNYLKPFPDGLKKKFYDKYGGEVTFSMLTASPVLGSLNSGMQLYRIKEEQPELFDRIRCSLHLPQYVSFLITGQRYSDITSIGCHTNLWNFSQDHYHEWVYREGITDKLAPLMSSTSVVTIPRPSAIAATGPSSRADRLPGGLPVGIGLHDSSAAMIPYLESFQEPFVLISTGTWCISMNPFNKAPLTVAELQKDCLCYMSYQGRPVKASRLFAGYEHEQQVRRLGSHFNKAAAYAATLAFDPDIVSFLRARDQEQESPAADAPLTASAFSKRELNNYANYEQAYHRLLMDIMEQQVASTQLVLEGTPVKRIFVDGGFGRNQVYMHLLAAAFPHIEVFAASIPQATAMGAALAIHPHWNTRPLPGDIIELKYYK